MDFQIILIVASLILYFKLVILTNVLVTITQGSTSPKSGYSRTRYAGSQINLKKFSSLGALCLFFHVTQTPGSMWHETSTHYEWVRTSRKKTSVAGKKALTPYLLENDRRFDAVKAISSTLGLSERSRVTCVTFLGGTDIRLPLRTQPSTDIIFWALPPLNSTGLFLIIYPPLRPFVYVSIDTVW